MWQAVIRLQLDSGKLIAKLGDKFKLPLNTERLNKLTNNYIVSNHKIKANLDKELPIKAKEGLRCSACEL